MIDRGAFAQHVHDALGHLYDFPFLETSPLSASMRLPDRGEGGISLHRILVDAIERLKPSRDVAADSAAWKNYRLLHLRYVRSLSASAVARELGLSARQAQRIQTLAVASVAALLRESYRPPSANPAFTEHLPSSDSADPAVAPDLVLDEELAAILSDRHPDPEPFPVTIRRAIDTMRPILEARQSSIELSIDEELASRIGPRHVIRPAIVQLLLAAVDRAGPGCLLVSARAAGASVELTIAPDDQLGSIEPAEWRETVERRPPVPPTPPKG